MRLYFPYSSARLQTSSDAVSANQLLTFDKPPSLPDRTLDQAARVLRLLHIAELRELQTKVNELIASVQALVADPKTNVKLGKVGK